MDPLERFSNVVLQIQEAALAPERWNTAISAIVRAVNASEGILFSQALPPSLGGFWASRAIQPHQMENYARYYHDKDIWMLAANPEQLSTPGFVFHGEALVSQAMVARSEFYTDFLAQMDIGRLLCSIVLPHGGDTTPGIHLSLFRPMRGTSFDDAQKEFVERLMPHLQASLRTHYLLHHQEQRFAWSHAALEALSTAVVIADRNAEVLFANDAARQIFCSADGLSTQTGMLFCASARETGRLRAFVASLDNDPDTYLHSAVHRIERPSGRRPYTLFGQRLPVDAALALGSARAALLLFIRDPEAVPIPEPEVLQALYGFTHAEALFALSLARGLTVEDAAAERGISYETARTRLKSLFQKTDCRRQVDLVKLIVGLG